MGKRLTPEQIAIIVERQPAPKAYDPEQPTALQLVENLFRLDADNRAVLEARALFGKEKYGVSLQPNNGRDPLVDSIQEKLDSVFYDACAFHETGNDIYKRSAMRTLDNLSYLYDEIKRSYR